MQDMILELLKAHRGMTLAHLMATLGPDGNRAENALQALKAEGKVRQDQCVIPKWHDDRDFECKYCGDSLPDVRRYSNKPFCYDCYYAKYKDSGVKVEHFSRFDPYWIGPSWAGLRSQEILTKARLSA